MFIAPIPDAVVAAIVSALLTGVLSYWVTRRSRIQSEKSQLQSLRKALEAEIESMVIEEVSYITITEGYDRFPTTVFQNNADKIGGLSEEELQAVIDFYGDVFITKSALERVRAASIHTDSMPSTPLSGPKVRDLQNGRSSALSAIRENLNQQLLPSRE